MMISEEKKTQKTKNRVNMNVQNSQWVTGPLRERLGVAITKEERPSYVRGEIQ